MGGSGLHLVPTDDSRGPMLRSGQSLPTASAPRWMRRNTDTRPRPFYDGSPITNWIRLRQLISSWPRCANDGRPAPAYSKKDYRAACSTGCDPQDRAQRRIMRRRHTQDPKRLPEPQGTRPDWPLPTVRCPLILRGIGSGLAPGAAWHRERPGIGSDLAPGATGIDRHVQPPGLTAPHAEPTGRNDISRRSRGATTGRLRA